MKDRYYKVMCGLWPDCSWYEVGNWKQKMVFDYYEHYEKDHLPKPYIKTDDKTKRHKIL